MPCPEHAPRRTPAHRAGPPHRITLRCLLPLLIFSLPLQPLAAGELNRLALAVAAASAPVRADFAVAAIYETAAAFAEEAQRARQENGPQRRELLRWANAVDAYATNLLTLVDRVSDATTIGIRVSAGDEIELDVAGSMVLISGPQPQLQSAFEQRILERFCELQPCTELVADFEPAQPVGSAPAIPVRWSFSEGTGPVCSNDEGLEFQFRNSDDLLQKRQSCERIVAELNQLAAQIARHKTQGIRIDWNQLAIHVLPEEPQQRVELNTDGDMLLMELPALGATERLFVLVKPWLAARVNGTTLHQVVINADVLMAPLFGPS